MLVHHLAKYAAYHRNPRNIATHMVGIPLIVLAVVVLLSRPVLPVGAVALTPAMLAALAATIWYLRLDRPFGWAMAAVLALACLAGLAIGRAATPVWLATGIGTFVLGWAIQFAGHAIEGRKPAFIDDLRGLLVGPLFVLAEIVFALGGRPAIHRAVQAEQTRF